MKLKNVLVLISAALPLATFGIASAASATPATATAASCDSLMMQADRAITTHSTARNIEAARKLKSAGEKECKSGDAEHGSNHLRQALTELGMKPLN